MRVKTGNPGLKAQYIQYLSRIAEKSDSITRRKGVLLLSQLSPVR